jgi:hypothetical protein
MASVNNEVDEVSEGRHLYSGPDGTSNGGKSSPRPGRAGNDREPLSTLGGVVEEEFCDPLPSGTSRARTTSSDLSNRSDGSSTGSPSGPCGDTVDLI